MLKLYAFTVLLIASCGWVFGLMPADEDLKPTEDSNNKGTEGSGKEISSQPMEQLDKKGGDYENGGTANSHVETEREIFDRGISLFKQKKWKQAYEVFMLAWRVFNETEISGGVHSISEIDIAEKVQVTAYKTKRIDEARAVCLRLLNHLPLTSSQRANFQKALDLYEKKLSILTMKAMYNRIDNATVEEKMEIAKFASSTKQYELCSDKAAIPAMNKLSENSKLFCRYDNRRAHPLLILSPLKEEILSLSPLLLIVYGLATDSEIKSIKDDAADRVQPGIVYVQGKDIVNPYSRKTETARCNEESMGNLLARLEAAFGLNPYPDGCLRYNVIHYGIGGHFRPHFDSRTDYSDECDGDGIASHLLYLNDVEEGGATAFTKLGIRIQATKGTGAFWFNYHKNETADFRTVHGACPILKGEKWSAFRWYMWRGQLLHRKHGMTENEDFTLEDLNLPPEIRFRK